MELPPFVGLTGPNASGKGELAAWLERAHGYARRSLSDVIREEARRRGIEPVRERLIGLGNELRQARGPGALAELVLPDLEPPALVDSIRNPAEVAVLRRLRGFVLLAVEAPLEMRFARSLDRARPGDPSTLEEFRAFEERENSTRAAGQRLRATADLADVVIVNDSSIEVLASRAEALLRRIATAARPEEDRGD